MARKNIVLVKFVVTDDLYHVIGQIYCKSLEKIDRIDYKEYLTKEDFELAKIRYETEGI